MCSRYKDEEIISISYNIATVTRAMYEDLEIIDDTAMACIVSLNFFL